MNGTKKESKNKINQNIFGISLTFLYLCTRFYAIIVNNIS